MENNMIQSKLNALQDELSTSTQQFLDPDSTATIERLANEFLDEIQNDRQNRECDEMVVNEYQQTLECTLGADTLGTNDSIQQRGMRLVDGSGFNFVTWSAILKTPSDQSDAYNIAMGVLDNG